MEQLNELKRMQQLAGIISESETLSNYIFTQKDAENKYKSAAISMLVTKLKPNDIPKLQNQLNKMAVDADFNVDKDGVRIWTREGDYSNVVKTLAKYGLKPKQTIPSDDDFQRFVDRRAASSGIKQNKGEETKM